MTTLWLQYGDCVKINIAQILLSLTKASLNFTDGGCNKMPVPGAFYYGIWILITPLPVIIMNFHNIDKNKIIGFIKLTIPYIDWTPLDKKFIGSNNFIVKRKIHEINALHLENNLSTGMVKYLRVL